MNGYGMRSLMKTISDKYTDKQIKALDLMRYEAVYTLLYGGARSGKSHIICRKIVQRAEDYPGARFLAARVIYAHAKTSIWNQTLVPMVKAIYPHDDYVINQSDFYIRFWNNSEIWLGGFDNKERIEKILGTEYLDIYFNEISQYSYDAVTIGLSRLAQKVFNSEGQIVKNRGYFDCNPPSPLHWGHKLFIEKREPVSGESLKYPELYNYMLMNPVDNSENLPPHYVERALDILPDRKKRRFKNGEWVKAEGAIYEFFNEETMIMSYDDMPPMEYYSIGIDFGLNMAAVLWGWCGDNLYLIDDYGAYNATTNTFNSQIDALWGHLFDQSVPRYCDPSGGERIQEITSGEPANNAVDDGIDFLNTKMEHGEVYATERATGFLSEIGDYKRDEKERIIKENDHWMDAGRYGAYSFSKPAYLGKQKQKRKPITAGMRDMRF